MKFVLVAIIGYLLGSFNGGQIVGKFNNVDIKKEGSGNAGTTNALRTMGKKAALATLIIDMAKGILACWIGNLIGGYDCLLVAGFMAVIGHNWPLYFHFKGGKGVLTTFTVLLVIDWQLGLILFGIFLIIVAISRMVSLGSIITAAIAFILAIIMGRSTFEVIILLLLGALIVIRHYSNIVRIIHGEEHKLGEKKK